MHLKNQGGTTIIEVVVILFVLFITLSGMSCGKFVNQDIAIRALETQGYTEIKIMEHNWFAVGLRGCGETDAAKFKASAINPAGKKVEVFVCSGWLFKGATIRTD